MLIRTDLSTLMRTFIKDDANYLEIVWAIEDFNRIFEIPVNRALYVELLKEETLEFIEELILHGVGSGLLKETTDILYILEGLLTMIEDEKLPEDIDQNDLGKVLATIWDMVIPVATKYFSERQLLDGFMETHRSNLSKLDESGAVLRREDGKVLKGPNYSPADLRPLYSRSEACTMAFKKLGMDYDDI